MITADDPDDDAGAATATEPAMAGADTDAGTDAHEDAGQSEAEPYDGPVLACEGLVKRFGERVAVDDVGFSIAPGESYGLLGPNGAGKTTTINLLCGLLRPDAGSVTISGMPLGKPAVKANIGYVPQEIALYPELSARENLRFFGRLYGLRRDVLAERISAALETAGLSDRADERIDAFSGGMKRRLNIAAGLLHEPTLLILDEPTVGVDPQSRHSILDHVAQLQADGLAVLYTSHYMEEVERLCDRVGIIDDGRLIAEGTTAELVASLEETDRITLTTDAEPAVLFAAVEHIAGVTKTTATATGVQLLARDGPRRLPLLLGAAQHAGATVTNVDVVRPNLESVFLHLTGKALRD